MAETTSRMGSLGAWEDRIREAQERKREAFDAWKAATLATKAHKASLDEAALTLDALVDGWRPSRSRVGNAPRLPTPGGLPRL
jgi:hypothetical protein